MAPNAAPNPDLREGGPAETGDAPPAASPDERRVWALFVLTLLALSWLQMMVLHESGHILAAWMVGGRVREVVLHPLALSRTEVAPNPRPRIVAWGGFAGGCGFPLLIWLAVRRFLPELAFLARFFAGSCLVANGAYLAGGTISRIGDARELLREGEHPAVMILAGCVLAAGGLAAWHGQGIPRGSDAADDWPSA